MNSKTAKKLRKIAHNENRHKKLVYKTYLQLSHKFKDLFLKQGLGRILDSEKATK